MKNEMNYALVAKIMQGANAYSRCATMLLLLFVFGIGGLTAASANTQGRIYLKAGAPTGAGQVYLAANSPTVPNESDYINITTENEETPITKDGTSGTSTPSTFYFYAQPNDGYKFVGWYSKNGDTYSLRTRELVWQGSVTSPSSTPSIGTSYTYLDCYASFIKIVNYSFIQPSHGSYSITNDGESVSEYQTIEANGIVHLIATPANGYKFSGWYSTTDGGVTKNYFSFSPEVDLSFSENATVGADFRINDGTPLFYVKGGGLYSDLSVAATQAESTEAKTIIVTADGTIPAGTYTIPSGVTLLVPFNAENQVHTTPSTVTSGTPSRKVYRTLTLANGVKITLNGSICVDAIMCLTMGYNGSAMNGYGLIDMKAGSTITMKSGSNFYVWGFVIGDGSIVAELGSTIHETFQFKHRGGNALTSIASTNASKKVFPINQYYIQSIEAPITFNNGASEKVYTGVHNVDEAISIDFIGTSGLFNLTGTDAYLIKEYDVSKDRQNYTLYGDATVGSIKFGMSGFYKESKNFVLPITNNMTLNIKTGTTTIQYETAILPDVEINIASEAFVTTSSDCYVYDSLHWKGAYAYANDYSADEKAQIAPVVYRHGGLQYNRKNHALRDAMINVNGTLTGKIYTTDGGANIKSSGTGKVTFTGETSVTKTYQAGQDKTTGKFDEYSVTSAQLRNADGSYTRTENNKLINTFEYRDGKWLLIVPENTAVENDKQLIVNYEEQLEAIDSLKVSDGGSVQVSTNVEKPIVIANGGNMSVENNDTELGTLALNACPAAIEGDQMGRSSQITGGENIADASNVYLDIQMNPTGSMNYLLWYTFAVPFNVAINDGVEKLDSRGNASPAVLGTDYRCYTYNGANRAQYGAGDNYHPTWEQVTASTDDGKFVPGKFYLVEFNSNAYNTFRFHKATNTPTDNTKNISLEPNTSKTGNVQDGGWNAIANTALKNAKITFEGGTPVVQVFNPINRKFESVILSETTFALGAAMFVQVTEDIKTANNSNSVITPASVAPRRMVADNDEKTYGPYTLRIGQPDSRYDDQLFVSATTRAKENYEIGKDLTKMFMGKASVSQMWINDYNSKLTMNQAVMKNNKAIISLTLYAPTAGEYEIALKSAPEDATIYLMRDGDIIANLNHGSYFLDLPKGESTQYGLYLNGIRKTPATPTAIDEAIADAVGQGVQKVLVDDRVMIIRDGKAYTVEGQLVK